MVSKVGATDATENAEFRFLANYESFGYCGQAQSNSDYNHRLVVRASLSRKSASMIDDALFCKCSFWSKFEARVGNVHSGRF